tara:strand:- start:926 stop:1192 length:267 start_codon:yes stop_codon:yes gene_type:complete
MRINYTFLSQETNDQLLTAYSHYAYLLGRDDANGLTTYSGVYDLSEEDLRDLTRKYINLRNDYAPDDTDSVPQYLDSIAYKIRNLGRA